MAYDGKGACGGCSATWGGSRRAHCAGCHRTFSVVSGFDKHRSAKGEHGSCVDPSTVDMVLSDGVWRGKPVDGGAKAAYWRST